MSTIFANKIKNNQGGNDVKVNQLSGIDTAGSINVTSDGGSTTTNLQQGLIKAYVCYTTSSTTAIHGSESFNHSSLTDITTGATKFAMTSAMSTSLFSLSDCGGDATAGYSSWVDDNQFSTTTYEFNLGNAGFGGQDGPYHAGQVIGKLA
tara:strand:+ start:3671 stop:4120 length:450 start_codon:yes stop_codon:yes gene_type:complete